MRSVGFSWDGSFVCGGSDEGSGIEIAHVETGEVVHTVQTAVGSGTGGVGGSGGGGTGCVAWHPGRYWLAYSGDASGLKIVGAAGGML